MYYFDKKQIWKGKSFVYFLSSTILKVIRETRDRNVRLDMFNTEGELRATEFTSIVLNSKIEQCGCTTSQLDYIFVPKISFLYSHFFSEKESKFQLCSIDSASTLTSAAPKIIDFFFLIPLVLFKT